MRIIAIIFAVFCFVMVTPQVKANDDLLSLGIGYYDINDNEDAVDFRLEYRWHEPVWWEIKPWVGAEATSEGAIYGVGGLLLDLSLTDHWMLTPSFGAGLYSDGDGKDLGSVIEFRSQIEVGYQFMNNSRLGVAFGHISNAGITDKNPGTEILNLYYHVPVDFFF